MNRIKISFSLTMLITVILFSVGCNAIPGEPTPSPFPTPDHSILASDMRKDSPEKSSVVYTLPEMDQVTVANVEYKDGQTMDVYYPPNFNFDQNLPVIIFVNGFRDEELQEMVGASLKDTGIYISWSQLVAAAGMSAVTYEANDPEVDIHDLINYVQADASRLRIDKDRICLWSSSANTTIAVIALTDPNTEYHDSLACGVIYYGVTPLIFAEDFSADIPLFIVKAGKDDNNLNLSLDFFVDAAREANVPLEFVEYEDGIHGFDARQDTDDSREIVRQTLEFMKTNLQD